MKLFEEFENDLRDVNSVKGLFKVMLANGVITVDVEEREFHVTEYGLIENVPQELWVAINITKYDAYIIARKDNVEIIHHVVNKEAFTERTGFEFPEVENEIYG